MPNWLRDGGYIHAVDTNILLSPDTIVAPANIFYFARTDIRYEFQGPRYPERLDNEYFGKMLTCTDWLEFVSRRVYDRQIRHGGVYRIVESREVRVWAR